MRSKPTFSLRPRAIRTVAVHEFRVNVRRPGFIFFTLLIPALGIIGLIITAFFSGQASDFLENQFDRPPAVIGVVDHTGLFTPIPPQFADEYRAFADEAAARQALVAETIGAYMVVPSNYVERGEIIGYAIGGFFDSVTALDSDNLRAFLVNGLLAGQVPPDLAERIADPSDITPVQLDETGQPQGGENVASTIAGFIIPYVLSIFLVISIFTASSYLLRSVSEEKETRVIEIVLSSVSASELLAGKVLGLGALGLTQVLVWLLSGALLTGGLGAVVAGVAIALKPSIFVLSLAYFLLGYLLYGTLMAAAGSLGTSMRESQQVAGIFSFAAAVPLMFNSLILAGPNGPIARALTYFPLTSPTTMMLRLPLTDVPPLDIAISLIGLVIAIPFVLWGGAKVFRMGLLLTGKRPALKQVWRALREA
jgi:ABC-2 type transport system permease protein